MADAAPETERLILRAWRDEDHAPFLAICSDPAVMAHLNGPQDAQAVTEMIERQQSLQSRDGHCLWAVERREDSALIGFCGLRIGGHAGTPVPQELEIGWRFARATWGQGYAREAAQASIAWGWANCPQPRIAAWTVPANTASWGLMLRLGMVHNPQLDFDHPAFAPGHPLRRHIVHIIERPA